MSSLLAIHERLDRLLRAGLVGAALLVTAAPAAHAQEGVEPIALAYDVPRGCPDSAAFLREITARTAKARAAGNTEKARILHVAIVRRPTGGFTGRLSIEDAAAWGNAREVTGGSCDEVVEALGLIGALAVDPKASTAPRASAGGSPPPTAPTPESSTPANPPLPPAPAHEPLPPAAQPSARAGTHDHAATIAAPRGAPARRRPRFGTGAEVQGSFIAGLVPAGRVFLDVELGPRDRRVLDPSLTLAIERSLDVMRHPAVGGATLRWTSGSLEGCPLRIALATTVAARPCLGASAGVLGADGSGVATVRSRNRPWVSADVYARLLWEPLRVLSFQLEVGGLAPFYREAFFFQPGIPIYETPVFAIFGRAGLGVRFP